MKQPLSPQISFYRTYRAPSCMGANDGIDIVWRGKAGMQRPDTEEIGPCYDPVLCNNDLYVQVENIVRMRGYNPHYITFELAVVYYE